MNEKERERAVTTSARLRPQMVTVPAMFVPGIEEMLGKRGFDLVLADDGEDDGVPVWQARLSLSVLTDRIHEQVVQLLVMVVVLAVEVGLLWLALTHDLQFTAGVAAMAVGWSLSWVLRFAVRAYLYYALRAKTKKLVDVVDPAA